MTDSPKIPLSAKSERSGGAAASAGILFQQQVGAFFGSALLAGKDLGQRVQLPTAILSSIRFETEAPIDDILIATVNGGYIAIQAKTSLTLSKNLDSTFGTTIDQLVRHWIECRYGEQSRDWNRLLEPKQDRLILAVSSRAPRTIREDLPGSLRRKFSTGSPKLNAREQSAWEAFETCAKGSWASVMRDELDPVLLPDLSSLFNVLVFDFDGVDNMSAQEWIREVLPAQAHASRALDTLQVICGQMMAKRTGADLAQFRHELRLSGLNVDAVPQYRNDIKALVNHTRTTIDRLKRHEQINAGDDGQVSITRDCQDRVNAAADDESFLIVGEPGAGKSAVINALTRYLVDEGSDVLALDVDRHSVESLEGLSRDLELEHGLIEVLRSWDGGAPGWLIIDALDATRGGKGETVFRTLIEQVLEKCNRWRVAASIRTFDLRMGQQFRILFKGPPPSEELAEPSFSDVRHFSISPWTDAELEQLLKEAPLLSNALTDAPNSLKELARIPFNTNLLGDIIVNSAIKDLREVSSQADLIQLYWERRVIPLGSPAEVCIRSILILMLKHRALKAAVSDIDSFDATLIDRLSREGVLLLSEDRRDVGFRHHILFDFAAAQVLLNPRTIVDGSRGFPREDVEGLMLSPALGYVLQEVWNQNADRANFWRAACRILSDQGSDPIIRSAVCRLAAKLPTTRNDTAWMSKRVAINDVIVAKALPSIFGALATRFDEQPETPLEPWAALAASLSAHVAGVAGPLRFLLFRINDHPHSEHVSNELGLAARSLLEYGYGLRDPGTLVTSAIELVADTFSTCPETSRYILSRVLERARLREFGWQEVPAICRKIETIVSNDPDFGVDIYRSTFEFNVTDERATNIGSSQILALRSTARQDYDTARYLLGEFFPTFLKDHPKLAVDVLVTVSDSYVDQQRLILPDNEVSEFCVNGRAVRLRSDNSLVWAHDPENAFGDDAEGLIVSFTKHLRTCDEGTAVKLFEAIVESAQLAVFWSRMFLVSVQRKDKMIESLLPFALHERFLITLDTRKDAIDVVAYGYDRLTARERESFERGALEFDFGHSASPCKTRASFLRRLFGAIGGHALVTPEAIDIADRTGGPAEQQNDRLFVIQQSRGLSDPYEGISGRDKEESVNANAMSAIDQAKQILGLEESNQSNDDHSLEALLSAMVSLKGILLTDGIDSDLRAHGEGVIGRGCSRIAATAEFLNKPNLADDAKFLHLLNYVAMSTGPEVDDDTEKAFERSPAWGLPAARVDAAEAFLNLSVRRSDLYDKVSDQIDRLLEDRHPAVRMQAGLHLIRIWDLDREGFWRRVENRLCAEKNAGVLEFLINGLLGKIIHADPKRVERPLIALLERLTNGGSGDGRLAAALARPLAVLWVMHGTHGSHAALHEWVADPTAHHRKLEETLRSLRKAFVLGLEDKIRFSPDRRRTRALDLASDIVGACEERLSDYIKSVDVSDQPMQETANLTQLVDTACMELYFATGASHHKDADERASGIHLSGFLTEAAPILRRIGGCATPRTVYYLLQLLECLLPAGPESVFDLTAHAIREGGRQTGFPYEHMGMELVVRLVGVFLADHKEIFREGARQDALIDCLTIFMDAGWPAAQRLLYRLPELVQ